MKVATLLIVLSLSLHANATGDAVGSGDPGDSGVAGNYSSDAQTCGLKGISTCSVAQTGTTHHMCGAAVEQMVECMAKTMKKDKCNANCGNGNDFINCGDGSKMVNCGYTKVQNNDPGFAAYCSAPGAVLAYQQGSKDFKKFGHVEMVCGCQQYCHIQPKPVDHAFNDHPDACWFPSPNGALPPTSSLPKSCGSAAISPSNTDVTITIPAAAAPAYVPPAQNYGGGGGGMGGMAQLMGPMMQLYAQQQAQQQQVGRVIWFGQQPYGYRGPYSWGSYPRPYGGAYGPYTIGGYPGYPGYAGYPGYPGYAGYGSAGQASPLYLTNGSLLYSQPFQMMNQQTTTSVTVKVGK